MAKNKAGAVVRFQVQDDGSLKRLGKESKKAGKAVDNLGKSERTLNRNFKGASRQSSNQTKNFSKMAQGITGGLVPAYATLAANIFAIGAAFRFLQSAGDLRILEQGQAEYAQRTGQNLAIMTRQLQAATDGQLAFAEAAQSVAIGTAAGLATKQINQLGIVAKNASLMLGRDLTDSFNRLVRGAVKAEPELLDELGIILRLETASEKYALSIGKTKQQLNIFEKSQAVVNEVLEQGLEKFGGVETQTNSITKLAKSFDDLVNSLKRAIGPLAEFMAAAMSNNTAAVAGAGMLLGSGVARAIIPKVPEADFSKGGQMATDKFSKMYKGKRDLQNLDKKGLDALVRDTKRAYATQSSTVIRFEKMKRSEALKTLEHMKIAITQEEAARAKGIAGMTARYKLMVLQFKQENNTLVAHTKAMGTLAARAFSTALRFVGYAGIIITVAGVLSQYLDKSSKAEKAAQAAQKEFGTLFSRNAEDLEKMVAGMKTYDSALTNALQSARALSNIDFSLASKGLADGMGGTDYSGAYKADSLIGRFQNMVGPMLYPDSAGKPTLSEGQTQGMQGILDMQKTLYPLLLANSDAAQQAFDILDKLGFALRQFKKGKGTQKDFDGMVELIESLKGGTIASKAMNNLAQTTQIMTSSAQDFNKALNSFRAPQTQLTRLTTNIRAVGEALSGVGEAFAKEEVALKFNAEKGTLFDKATTDMLTTFLSEKDMEGIDGENSKLRGLAARRDQYKEDGNTQMYDKTVALITKRGSKAFELYGQKVTAEAERLHKKEMQMIKDKTKVQKNLITLGIGATKGQTKQLKMQGAITKNNLEAANQQTLINELEAKGINKDEAQIVLETEKLALMHAQGLELQFQIDKGHQLQMAMKNSFEGGIAGTIDDLITGKNSSLSEGMMNLAKGVFESFSKTISDQMATGISNFLFGNKELEGYEKGAQIIREAHIQGISQGMGTTMGDIGMNTDTGEGGSFFGKAMNFMGSFFGFSGAKGGITPVYAASGGVFSGSKAGYPAMMHGSEAVVPLPDGKSIPISGNLGGTVNVAVNMTTGESSSTTDSSDMIAMGESIAQAVQNEIEKQQRPGGQLSPY